MIHFSPGLSTGTETVGTDAEFDASRASGALAGCGVGGTLTPRVGPAPVKYCTAPVRYCIAPSASVLPSDALGCGSACPTAASTAPRTSHARRFRRSGLPIHPRLLRLLRRTAAAASGRWPVVVAAAGAPAAIAAIAACRRTRRRHGPYQRRGWCEDERCAGALAQGALPLRVGLQRCGRREELGGRLHLVRVRVRVRARVRVRVRR